MFPKDEHVVNAKRPIGKYRTFIDNKGALITKR